MKKLIVFAMFLTLSFLAYQGCAEAEEMIHVCINKAGLMRVVDDAGECKPQETHEYLCRTCGTDVTNQYWKVKSVDLDGYAARGVCDFCEEGEILLHGGCTISGSVQNWALTDSSIWGGPPVTGWCCEAAHVGDEYDPEAQLSISVTCVRLTPE